MSLIQLKSTNNIKGEAHRKNCFSNMVHPNLFGNKKEREAFCKEFLLHPMIR